jgi:recombination DNA repair RAD52 pathway protein
LHQKVNQPTEKLTKKLTKQLLEEFIKSRRQGLSRRTILFY